MHTAPGLVCSDRPEGCLLSCFDPSATQTVLRFASEGRAWQYRVLPFGLSLSARVFTKIAEGALAPLREVGIRILNCLEHGPHARTVMRSQGPGASAPQPVGASGQLGKEQALPCAENLFSRCGVRLGEYDGPPHGRARPVGAELPEFLRRQDCGPTETVSEAPGAYGIRSRGHAARIASYETTSALVTLPSPEVGMAPRCTSGEHHTGVSPLLQPLDRPCLSTGRGALRTSVSACCRHNRCLQHGLGRYMQRQAASGLWTGPRLLWHINCLELLAVHLALRQFRPLLLGKHVLVRTDNTAAVSYINRMGGIRSRRMSQLARHLLLWSHSRLKSLRAVHIPGVLNRAADALSRQLTFPGEWRLHPETIRLIWSRFGEAQVDLFASRESSHCQWFSPWPRAPSARTHWHTAGLGLYASMHSPSEPARTDTVQSQGGRGAGPAGRAVLAHPDLVSRTHSPRDSPFLAHSSEEGLPFSGARHHLAPASRPVEPPCVAPGWDAADLSGLPQAVVETITQAGAPSTRQAYVLKWSLFANRCSSRREDPRRCTIGVVLSFLQERLERRLSPSTLKVDVAAIAARHDAVDGRSLGKHDLIVRFLRGARRLNPPRLPLRPSWDLSIILAGLQRGPCEPLDSVELREQVSSGYLSAKTALLTALTSIKRVRDLQAFSVSEECLVFGPDYSHVVLRPRPGYVPKVPTTPFRDQVVNLQALPSEEADPALALLCPVRALRIYVDRTRRFRSSEQLLVCYGGQQKGKAVSKQRLTHWIVDAIALAYQSQGEPCPMGVRAHSTRSVASSYALAHGASLADICRAAGWATPNTFARFYSLCVEPVSSRVLGNR